MGIPHCWKPLLWAWQNSPNSPIFDVIRTSVPFSGQDTIRINMRVPSSPEPSYSFRTHLKTNIFGWFFFFFSAKGRWKCSGEVCSFSSSSFQAWGTLSPRGSQRVSVPLINNLQPLWSPSKINWRSVRPESPWPTQEKTRQIQISNFSLLRKEKTSGKKTNI